MPYFVYKVFSNKTLEPVDTYDKYREAKLKVRELRGTVSDNEPYTYRMVFARHQTEAERLLTQKREPRPLGEDA